MWIYAHTEAAISIQKPCNTYAWTPPHTGLVSFVISAFSLITAAGKAPVTADVSTAESFPPFFACHQSGGRDFRFPRLCSRIWIMQQCGVACLTEWLDKNSWVRTVGDVTTTKKVLQQLNISHAIVPVVPSTQTGWETVCVLILKRMYSILHTVPGIWLGHLLLIQVTWL